ncbi:hypothetical protein STAFG_7752 [Streptomyces afghaniensis 772]|uniref:Uncharacterized protein n=1 Tax=Streptomyces afghaniensis 772 TaxID=1283301 RepID=S4MHX7_9ACTN|nr:hypothetical protein [Streptomyces afghaniensis]EPJ35190.1 hypothetical protein STAFG_7752 [Streptomyces afghaniensis 772]
MSGEVVVKVSWGPRPETPLQLAQRWLELLTGLSELSELSEGAPAEWRWEEDSGPGQLVPVESEDFTAALEAANTQDDRDILGYTANVVATQSDGAYLRARVIAGGSNEYSPFTAVLHLFPASGAAAVPLTGRFTEVLALLADVWDADHGLTYDRPLYNELRSAYGLRASHPRAGWAVYLSESRAARVPDDFSALRRLPARHGGVVLEIADSSGGTPSTQAVLAAHKTLAGTGALDPLPVPSTEAKL